MDCNQVQDLLEGYVLDALNPDEHNLVEQHLATCADCQRKLAEYQTVAAMLPVALASASSVRPPAALKDRIFQAIDASTTPVPPIARLESNGKGIGRSLVPQRNRRILIPLAAAVLVLVLLAL